MRKLRSVRIAAGEWDGRCESGSAPSEEKRSSFTNRLHRSFCSESDLTKRFVTLKYVFIAHDFLNGPVRVQNNRFDMIALTIRRKQNDMQKM
jgi:hypothetical protein